MKSRTGKSRKSKYRLLLFDGDNLAHRALWGGKPLTNPRNGDDVGLLFRFLRSVEHTCRLFPRHLPVMFWDNGKSEAKTKMLPSYKGHRGQARAKKLEASGKGEEADEMRQEFKRQTKILKTEVLPYLGIPQVSYKGVEADDLMFLIMKEHLANANSAIITTDRDLVQCVRRGVQYYDPLKKIQIHRKNLAEHTGFGSTKEWLLYRAMVGDASDNIKGVPGIGAKRASAIVSSNPDVTAPWVFLEAELEGDLAQKLQTKMDGDPDIYKQLLVSWKVQSLAYWYKKYKHLAPKFGPKFFLAAFLKFDRQAYESWCMKVAFREPRRLGKVMGHRHVRWLSFFKHHKLLKKIPKEMR